MIEENPFYSQDYDMLAPEEKIVLHAWIIKNIEADKLWSFTSLGLLESFRNEYPKIKINEQQFKCAMVIAGFNPRDEAYDMWDDRLRGIQWINTKEKRGGKLFIFQAMQVLDMVKDPTRTFSQS